MSNVRKMNWVKTVLILIGMVCVGWTQAWGAEDHIRIGATVSATGHFATEIGPFKNLFRAWAEQVNRDGGIFLKEKGKKVPVEVVIYDDKSQVPVVTRYYERLIAKDRVDFLVGPYSSPLTFAASIPAEKSGTPFLAVCANSPKIYSRGFKWVAGVIDLAPRYTWRYWEMVKKEAKARSVSFVVEDTMHPRGVYRGSKALAEQAGLRVAQAEVVPPETHDFTGLISRLKRAKADIIYVSSNIPLAISFMKQAREKGLKAKEYHVIHHSGVFLKALGKGAEGVVGQSYWSRGMGFEGEREFLDILKSAGIQTENYPWAPAYMSGFQIIEAAYERAGTTDKTKVMETLKAGTYRTLCGIDRFHKTGYGHINTYPSQIQGGQYRIIWPPDRATAPHIYPSLGM